MNSLHELIHDDLFKNDVETSFTMKDDDSNLTITSYRDESDNRAFIVTLHEFDDANKISIDFSEKDSGVSIELSNSLFGEKVSMDLSIDKTLLRKFFMYSLKMLENSEVNKMF